MELRQLQYFVTIAQEHSFSKAAEKIYISEQALSKSMACLEGELGTPLFRRSTKGVFLTEYGQVFLEKSSSILDSVEDTFYDLEKMKRQKSSMLRLAITAGIGSWLDLGKLIHFQTLYPNFQISTVVTNDRYIEKALISGSVGIALMGAQGDSSMLEFTCLKKSTPYLAVNRKNPLVKKDVVDFRDLRNENFIFSSEDYYASTKIRALCRRNGFTPYAVHQTCDIPYVLSLLEMNQGVFFLAGESKEAFDKPFIKLLNIKNNPEIFNLQLVTLKNADPDEGTKLLYDYIYRMFRPSGDR